MSQPQSSHCRLRLGFERLEPRLALSGTGLTAQYFHNADFTGLAETRTEAVNFNWVTANAAPGMDADSFSVRWTGQVVPEYSQLYSFSTLSDEGVRVWVDGKLLIDDFTPHTRRSDLGTISLQAGQAYDIRVDYFDLTGVAQMQLFWSSASQPTQLIPATALYESPAGLLGSYSDGTGGTLWRVDPGVNFNWGLASPAAGIDADGFNVTWSGQLRADYSDQYTFSMISDDGVRLWIGNELVINNWTSHSATEDRGTKQLEAGKWYDVRLEYFDNTGSAQALLRWSSARQTGDGNFDGIPQSNLKALKDSQVTFKNPLGVGADPFVVQWQGYYYMTMTTNGKSVSVTRAKSLEDIHSSSPGSDAVLAWSAPAGTDYSDQVWAPELHRIGDSWYIYVAASDGNNANHRMHVLERNAVDPFGPFTYKAEMFVPTDRWAIDGTVFEWQGAEYFVWSGWSGTSNGQQNLYIAEMRNPWTILGDRVLLSVPQYSWEMQGMPINEGPEALIHDGQLHIVYSASGYWTPQYALGRLTYNGIGPILSAASWTKASQPVFQAGNGVVGVGHASFTKSPDGTEDWIVYHAHRDPQPGPNQEIRDIRIQPFTYFTNGTPNFGAPLPLSQSIVAPSVGPDPERPFVSGDYNADGVVSAADQLLWQATFGVALFPNTSADGNGDGTVDAADYVLWRNSVGAGAPALRAATAPSTSTEQPNLIRPLSAAGLQQNEPTTREVRRDLPAEAANVLSTTQHLTDRRQEKPLLSRSRPAEMPRERTHDSAIEAWLAATVARNLGVRSYKPTSFDVDETEATAADTHSSKLGSAVLGSRLKNQRL